jgi:peptidoglycan/xylan/chitin deacetylase (PgdA/CDA1 family)
MSTTIMLIWDYDTPTGYAVSHQSRHADPMSEYRATDRILNLLAEYGIVSTFACVGEAAEPGPLPYHNPGQIRTIHAAGHEIASHSHGHELIPALTIDQLHQTLRRSKAALEDCIGHEVIGFVPPWNRPFHHPQWLSFSLQDWRAGGGRWRHSVFSLCAALQQCGYKWVRIASGNIWRSLLVRLFPKRQRLPRPRQAVRYHGVTALPIGYFGYDKPLVDWLTGSTGAHQTLVVYAHPHGITHNNAQHWQHLVGFVSWIHDNAAPLDVAFTTPSDWLERHAAR